MKVYQKVKSQQLIYRHLVFKVLALISMGMFKYWTIFQVSVPVLDCFVFNGIQPLIDVIRLTTFIGLCIVYRYISVVDTLDR